MCPLPKYRGRKVLYKQTGVILAAIQLCGLPAHPLWRWWTVVDSGGWWPKHTARGAGSLTCKATRKATAIPSLAPSRPRTTHRPHAAPPLNSFSLLFPSLLNPSESQDKSSPLASSTAHPSSVANHPPKPPRRSALVSPQSPLLVAIQTASFFAPSHKHPHSRPTPPTARRFPSQRSLKTSSTFTKPISQGHPSTSEFMSIENLKSYGM